MPALLDEICPAYVGERKLTLALSADTLTPKALSALEVTVDYSQTLPESVALPLELTVTAPTRSNFIRRIFRRAAPSSLIFVPREGGRHVLRLGEVGHNRWWGSLTIDVQGEVATNGK